MVRVTSKGLSRSMSRMRREALECAVRRNVVSCLMEFLVIFLGSAVGSALIQGLFAFFIQDKGDKAAKGTWIRDKKFAVYEKHLQDADAWVLRVNTDGPRGLIRRPFLEEWMGAYSATDLALVATDEVQGAARDYRNDTHKWFSIISGHVEVTPEQRKAAAEAWLGSHLWMTNLMRADLGFTDRVFSDRDPEDPKVEEIRVRRDPRQHNQNGEEAQS